MCVSLTIISTEAASVPGGVGGSLFYGRGGDDGGGDGDSQRKKTHIEASESQGLKVQTSKFTCWSSFPVVGNVTPICSRHSIIRKRL